jgi:hypothetical protein
LCFQGVTHGDSFTGIANNTRGIEVYVGQRGEERARGKVINLMVDDAVFTCFNSPCRQTLQGSNQQILQIGGFSRFTAHTLRVRAAVSCRSTDGLFTLHTKHGHTF